MEKFPLTLVFLFLFYNCSVTSNILQTIIILQFIIELFIWAWIPQHNDIWGYTIIRCKFSSQIFSNCPSWRIKFKQVLKTTTLC